MATGARQKVGIDINGSLPMSLSDPSATGALPDGMEDAPLIHETSMEQFPTLFSCRLGKWTHQRIPEPAPSHWKQPASWLFTCLDPFGSGWYDFSPSRKLLITGLRDLWGNLRDTTERSVTSIGRSESPWRGAHGWYCVEFDFCLDCDSPTR
ncbi:uncharacterized protein BDZ83DRAFT_746557 [Colletotrichum acutatum]|uniref:Uncharacterized protein n=1 Tax=Glomerella acutata TaxID=27357 RepID=A0AAD9D2T0_GLOAC|nr:uncharacterized protein BDZ83DRAFT_746557 [Colletotrichum acutatum]KAK1731633.1 hypothetical protein BDZ83DRAFT_746557 [Colletotrichum acutatum]